MALPRHGWAAARAGGGTETTLPASGDRSKLRLGGGVSRRGGVVVRGGDTETTARAAADSCGRCNSVWIGPESGGSPPASAIRPRAAARSRTDASGRAPRFTRAEPCHAQATSGLDARARTGLQIGQRSNHFERSFLHTSRMPQILYRTLDIARRMRAHPPPSDYATRHSAPRAPPCSCIHGRRGEGARDQREPTSWARTEAAVSRHPVVGRRHDPRSAVPRAPGGYAPQAVLLTQHGGDAARNPFATASAK